MTLLITFLQTNPIDKTNELTRATIELAEATYNYGALKMVFALFMVVVIGMLLVFGYQFLIQTKKINQIHESSEKVSRYFEDARDREIGPQEANILIRRALNSDATIVKYMILRTRLENHIDNQQMVYNKIERLVENTFNEIQSFLSQFSCEGRPLSDYLEHKDAEEVKKIMIEQVYRLPEEFTVFSMDQTIDLYFNGLKTMYLKKLPI